MKSEMDCLYLNTDCGRRPFVHSFSNPRIEVQPGNNDDRNNFDVAWMRTGISCLISSLRSRQSPQKVVRDCTPGISFLHSASRFQPRHSGSRFLPALEQLPAPTINPSPSQPVSLLASRFPVFCFQFFFSRNCIGSVVASPAAAAPTITHSFQFICVSTSSLLHFSP